MSERSYSSGVIKALFMLSRGRCYEPSCRQPVMRLINGAPIVNVHIAHICSHEDNGPRCVLSMSKEERRSFRNLILLCVPHHKLVDNKRNELDYPEVLLRQWKLEREGDYSSQLEGLDNLTEDKLQRMMAEAVSQTNNAVTKAIDELDSISKGAADILRELKTETFERPYLDLDAVESLAESAYLLRNLEDNSSALYSAAWKLEELEIHATTLHSAAQMLSNLEVNAVSLQSSAKQIKTAAEQVTTNSWNAPVAKTSSAPSSIGYYRTSRLDNRRCWLYFKWGVGIGAFIVVAIVVAVLYMIHRAH